MTGTTLSATGSYTDEQAQDAVGAMVDASLVYVDGTPLLTRAALTGDVTATQGSNATTIANAAVTLAKMADLAQDQFIGRVTASTGVPETATITAAARTVLDDTTVAAMVVTIGAVAKDGSIAMTGALQMGDQNITGAKTITFGSAPDSQTYSSGTLTVDFSAGQKHTVTLNASPSTIVFTAPAGIGNFMLVIKQGTPNTNTMTGWPATVKWPGGTAPTITTGASKVDVLSFYWDGTNYWGQFAQNFT
jgi:hypothetical protein